MQMPIHSSIMGVMRDDMPAFLMPVDRTMTPNEFRQLQLRLGLDQVRFGQFLGVTARTVRRYATGQAAIPHATVLLLRLIERYGLNVAI